MVFGLCWLSQCVEAALPFSLPAGIVGMVVLLALLAVRAIRTEHIQDLSDFLLGNLPFFFIPAAVSIIQYVDLIKSNLAALVVVCVVSTVATFAATAWAVTWTVRWLERRKQG